MKPGLWYLLLGFVPYLVTGESSSLPYIPNGNAGCRNSTTEYVVDSINRCCSKCMPGTRKTRDCTIEENTVCEECQINTFIDSVNYYPKCFSCSKCDDGKGLQYERQCSTANDAICVCKPDWFCILGYEAPSCSECQMYRNCSPGNGAKLPRTPDDDIKCQPCPNGTFSSDFSRDPCKPHTRCDAQGRSVSRPGTSTSDAICGTPKPATSLPVAIHNLQPTTQTTSETSTSRDYFTTPSLAPFYRTTEVFLKFSTSLTSPASDNIGAYFLVVVPIVGILVLLVVAIWICHRRGTSKPAVDGDKKKELDADPAQILSLKASESQRLLENSKNDLSTSSTSSDSHSQGTGISQESTHTEHTVSGPCVNVNITATINCQVNPATGSCTIPISPCVQQPEPELPLSQEEELCTSCQQEDGKSALQSVQESGMTK